MKATTIDKNILPPNILLEDGAVFVMNKPGGLLTQAPPGIDSLELRTKHFLKVRDEKPGKVYLGVPHRLDRPVSGVISVVKNVRAAQRISAYIRDHKVNKTYLAVVTGTPPEPSGEWKDFMRKIPDQARSEIVEPEHHDAQEARLNFCVLASDGNKTLLEIELITGRTHQIRLQCSHRGFPILGDEMYGSQVSFGPQTTDLRKRWIALHARRLVFEHPISHQTVDQTAPLPDCWQPLERLTRDC